MKKNKSYKQPVENKSKKIVIKKNNLLFIITIAVLCHTISIFSMYPSKKKPFVITAPQQKIIKRRIMPITNQPLSKDQKEKFLLNLNYIYSLKPLAQFEELNESFKSLYNRVRFFFNDNFHQSQYFWSFLEKIYSDMINEQINWLENEDPIIKDKQQQRIGILLWLLDKASACRYIGGNKTLENYITKIIAAIDLFIENRLYELTSVLPKSQEMENLKQQLKAPVNDKAFEKFWIQRNIDEIRAFVISQSKPDITRE